MSSSDVYDIVIQFENLGEVKARLRRIYSPLTISRFLNTLPYRGIAYPYHGFIYIPCDLRIGIEKPVQTLKPNQIAYWPQKKCIVITYNENVFSPPCNLLGDLMEDHELIKKINVSTRVLIKLL